MDPLPSETQNTKKPSNPSFLKHHASRLVYFVECFLSETCNFKRLSLPVSLILIILPVVFMSVFLIVREHKNQTTTAYTHRESLATLEALFVQGKFDGVVDVGNSLASCPCIFDDIKDGNWDDAIKTFEHYEEMFPYINSISVLDEEGILKATNPSVPELIGKSFADHDYYRGVSRKWEPYVSNVFASTARPKYNAVAVAIPIKSPYQNVLGILVLTINLNTIVEWSEEVDVGKKAFTYIVDKEGKLMAHPDMKHDGEPIDYSSVPIVQKLVNGEHGVELAPDPFDRGEQVVAYAPIKKYGFGIAVSQASAVTFSERSSKVAEYVMFWGLIILSAGFVFYLLLKDRIVIMGQRDRERVLLESMGDGVVVIDRAWNITLWNKAATTITGWNKEEAMGMPFRSIVKFIRDRDRKEDIAFIEDAIVMGRVSFMEAGTLLIRKDGSEISVDDSVAPLAGQNGDMDGAIIVFRDASKSHEEAHLRSDLAYATHQLRTPVTEALWNLETGMSEQDSEKRDEDLRVAYQALLSIKKLSEHLVAVSEIDQGAISIKKSMVKLIDVFSEVEHKLGDEAKKHNVEISINPISPVVAINTDSKFLGKILCEIIENAVVYSKQGDKVVVATTFNEKEMLIEVADTGMGISEEQQPLVYTKFFRGTNTGRMSAGSGLGLYLAKEYVALLDGKMWFTSEEGRGTTFCVSLPLE